MRARSTACWRRRAQGKYIFIRYRYVVCAAFFSDINAAHIFTNKSVCRRHHRHCLFLFLFIHFGLWFQSLVHVSLLLIFFIAKNSAIIRFNLRSFCSSIVEFLRFFPPHFGGILTIVDAERMTCNRHR